MTLTELWWSFKPGGIKGAKRRHEVQERCHQEALKAAKEIRKLRKKEKNNGDR